jgi:hypothetical protein
MRPEGGARIATSPSLSRSSCALSRSASSLCPGKCKSARCESDVRCMGSKAPVRT